MSRVRTAGTSSSFCGDGAAGFWWHAGFGVVSASWGCFSDLLVKNPVISDAPPPPALVDPGATPPLPFDDTLLFFEGGVSQAAAIALFFVCTTSAGGATQASSCCSIHPQQKMSPFAAFFALCVLMDGRLIDLIKTSKRARDNPSCQTKWIVLYQEFSVFQSPCVEPLLPHLSCVCSRLCQGAGESPMQDLLAAAPCPHFTLRVPPVG